MSSSNNQPDALAMPFANNGDKSTIPSVATGTNKASLTEGFPQITSKSIAEGGIPPSREDFNALGNISTSHNYFMQNGGGYTFVPAVSTAIGGYPKGALLWYKPATGNPVLLVSTKNNNTDNFNTNQSYIGAEGSGKSWEVVTVSGENFVNLTTNQTINGAKTFKQNVFIQKDTESILHIDNLSADVLAERTNTNWVGSIKFRGKNNKEIFNIRGALLSDGTQLLYNIRDYSDSTKHLQSALESKISKSGVAELRYIVSNNGSGDTRTIVNNSLSKITSLTTDLTIPTMGWVNNPDKSTNVVHRSGNETITGLKNISNNGQDSDNSQLDITCTNIDLSTSPSGSIYAGILFKDVNGNRIGKIENCQYTEGRNATVLDVTNANGDHAQLNVTIASDGTGYATAPASDKTNSIVTTTGINKSNNGGYVKFGNGLIIQWGEASGGTTDETITFPTAFTSYLSYSVSVQHINGNNSELWPANIAARNTTYFHLYSRGGAVSIGKRWIAVGY